MKLAIIGTGMIVQEWLMIAKDLPQIELTAILGTSRSQKKVASLASQYNIKKTYFDYNQLLDDSTIDTVYIALPNSLHFSFTKAALLAEKNVILEKPFASNLKEFLEIEAIIKSSNVYLFEAITNQYLANFYSLKEKLPEIGDVKIVDCNYSQYSSRYDQFLEGIIQPAFDPTKSGGALMDLNIYNLHLVVGLFGKPQSVNYFANIDRGIDTSGIVALDYGSFKAVCTGAKDCSAPVTSTIQGNKGCLRIDGPTNEFNAYTMLMNKQEPVTIDVKKHPHRMYEEFVLFEKWIRENNRDVMFEQLEHSKIVMEIVEKAKASAGIVFSADK